MRYDRHLIGGLKRNPAYLDVLRNFDGSWQRWSVVRMLVVVDEQIATASGAGFGVGSVIERIRGSSVGCVHCAIDIAQTLAGALAALDLWRKERQASGWRLEVPCGRAAAD